MAKLNPPETTPLPVDLAVLNATKETGANGEETTVVGRKPSWKKRLNPGAYIFLSPTMLIFGVFVMFPVLFSFYLSFHKWNMFSEDRSFIGFDNYARIVQSPEFWMVLKNTAFYTLGTVPLNMALALGMAVMLNKQIVGKKFLRAAFFTPVIVSPVAAGMIWRWIYEPNYGLLNYALGLAHLPSVNWVNDPTGAMIALIIMGMTLFKSPTIP